MQWSLARVLEMSGKLAEAAAYYESILDTCARLSECEGSIPQRSLRSCWNLLHRLGRARDAVRLKNRAARAGCDVSELV